MEQQNRVLSIEHLKKNFGGKEVLRDVNFSIERGEVVGLLGINGAGKTTLMNCIAGTVPFTDGRILFRDKELCKNRELLRSFGFLLRLAFLDYLTAEENLKVLGAYSGIDKRELDSFVPEVLKTVHLYEKKDEHTSDFSFGQQQRLGVAQAILGKKDVLVLDEPFVGLDRSGRKILETLILSKAKNEGTAVLLSSHDLEEINKVCDRVLLLKKGEIIYDGAYVPSIIEEV